MLSTRPRRYQGDGKQDEYSALTAIDTGSDTEVRQEDAALADINNIVKTFGMSGTRRGTYGDVDYTLDRQQAVEAIREADIAWNRLPVEIRNQYKSMANLLKAADRGEIEVDRSEPEPSPKGDDNVTT